MFWRLIVVGEPLVSGGGVVITGARRIRWPAKVIARRDGPVDCASHSVNPIVEGEEARLFCDMPVALCGYRRACRCRETA